MDQPQAAPPRLALHYDGRIGELYLIFLLNVLLTVLTLGIYGFWAVTRVRKYVWSRTAHDGRRFAYHGTGGELFVGWLLAVLSIMALIGAAVGLALLLPQWLAPAPLLLLYPVLGVLGAGAVYAAQRYRLSRTEWAGVRGGMGGSPWRYGAVALGMYLLLPLTLGQLLPWVQVQLAERRINASFAGATPFRFAGQAKAVYPVFLAVFLGSFVLLAVIGASILAGSGNILSNLDGTRSPDPADLPRFIGRVYGTLFLWIVLAGTAWAFYRAHLLRHIMGRTTVGAMRLGSSATGWGLAWLVFSNGLILVFTLGLGYPVTVQRNARYLARTTWVQGRLDPATLGQPAGVAPRFGEGLYSTLDGGGFAT